MGVLTVHLDRISNLRDEDLIGRSDPYVMFELEQDNYVLDKSFGKHQSTTKKNTCNPKFGEDFTFEDIPSLDNMVLHVKVLDEDTGIDDKIGNCKIKLYKLDLSEEPTETETVIDHKKGEGWFSRKAKIHLKISYAE